MEPFPTNFVDPPHQEMPAPDQRASRPGPPGGVQGTSVRSHGDRSAGPCEEANTRQRGSLAEEMVDAGLSSGADDSSPSEQSGVCFDVNDIREQIHADPRDGHLTSPGP